MRYGHSRGSLRMTTLAAGLDYVDLTFLGIPEIIATAVLHGAAGVALIDPGPVDDARRPAQGARARKGIAIADVRQILLTHIHLDHAGATGTLVRENPAIEVFVHERGAPHLVDPVEAARERDAALRRRHGAPVGEFLPVPADRVRALTGRGTITAGGRELRGRLHARTRVASRELLRSRRAAWPLSATRPASGAASGTYVMPPTPPPDIDLEAWRASEDRILAWDPDTLFLTHFGPFHGAPPPFHRT